MWLLSNRKAKKPSKKEESSETKKKAEFKELTRFLPEKEKKDREVNEEPKILESLFIGM